MKNKRKVSNAEWEIMNLIWEKFPLTVTEIVAKLAGRKTWNAKTIGTLLNRLTRKGILRYEKDGRRYLYYPQALRETVVRDESRSFIEKVFGGRTGAMLAHFVQEANLSPDEIKELEQLLAKKGG